MLIFVGFFVLIGNAQENEEVVSSECPTIQEISSIKTPLRFGRRNNDVGIVQRALTCLGYLDRDNVTNYFGRNTLKSIKDFCEDEGIRCSGRIFTRTILERLIRAVTEVWGEDQQSNISIPDLSRKEQLKSFNAQQSLPIKKNLYGVKLLSPNGGEVWEVGKTYEIKWDAKAYPQDARIQIGLYNVYYSTEAGPCPEITIANTLNTGSYLWTVSVPWKSNCFNYDPKLYHAHKVKIYVEEGGEGKFDESDLPFSIVQPVSAGIPDLDFAHFAIDPSPLKADKPVTYEFSLRNKGTAPAYNVVVKILNAINNWQMGGLVVPQLDPGQIWKSGMIRDSSPFWATCANEGLNLVRLIVDPDDQIKESDENNNILEHQVMLEGCTTTSYTLEPYIMATSSGVLEIGWHTNLPRDMLLRIDLYKKSPSLIWLKNIATNVKVSEGKFSWVILDNVDQQCSSSCVVKVSTFIPPLVEGYTGSFYIAPRQ